MNIKTKRSIIFIIAMCVSIMANVFSIKVSAASVPTFEETELGNLPGNSNNGGLAVTDGKYIYYISLYKDRINRMDMSGKNHLNVIKADARNLSLINGWIYYSDRDEQGIYKVRVDGSNKTLIKGGVDPNFMQVTASGWIYYNDSKKDNKLYKMSIGGGESSLLSKDSIGEFIVFEDHVVVQNETQDYNMYWIDSTNNTTGRMTKCGVEGINYAKRKFYYSNMDNKESFYSMSAKGTGVKKIRSRSTRNTVVYKDKLYYTDGQGYIYNQVLTAKTQSKKLSSRKAEPSAVVGKWVVYAENDKDICQIYYMTTSGTSNKQIPAPTKTVTGAPFNDAEATSVKLSSTSVTLKKGNTLKVTATVLPSNTLNKSVIWSSSNSAIATVDQGGLVAAREVGTATITATTYNGKKATCTVKVTTGEILVTSVTMSKTTATINVGDTVKLAGYIKPSNATNTKGYWTSSNNAVATVDNTGLVRGVGSGTARITVSTSNGKSAYCTVTVKAKTQALTTANFEVYNLAGKDIKEFYMTDSTVGDWGNNLISSGKVMKNNDSTTLKITFNKTTKYDIKVKYTDNTEGDFRGLSFATASSSGGAILLSTNEVTLHPIVNVPLKFTNNTGKRLIELRVSSTLIPEWGNNLIPSGLSNNLTKTIILPMTSFDTKWDIKVVWDNGGKREEFELKATDFGTLSTSGTTVYLVSQGDNLVMGVGQKPAGNIDATSAAITPATVEIEQGKTSQLVANVLPGNTTNKAMTWSSNNTKIASVDSNGVVTGLQEGTAIITAKTSNGVTATCAVTVKKQQEVLTTGRFSVYNTTSKNIQQFYMTVTGGKDYGNDLLGSSQTIPANGSFDLDISFSKTTSYDIYVIYTDNSTAEFKGLSFSTASNNGGAILLKNGNAELHPFVAFNLTVVNNTGKDITSFKSSSAANANYSVEALTEPLKNGTSIIQPYLLAGFDVKWNLQIGIGSDGYEIKGVDFGNLSINGATLELTMNEKGEVQYTLN